jgi:hypothetical protein
MIVHRADTVALFVRCTIMDMVDAGEGYFKATA